MGAIIRMDSKEFLNTFIKKEDYRKYNFLLISEDIKTEKEFKNVYDIKALIPPPNVISVFVNEGMSDKYVKKYIDYLRIPKIEALITVIVKLAVVHNSNVILLCSKSEDEFKYLKILCQYIEKVYKVKTYTYKKYKANPEDCGKIKNKKKVIEILNDKIENFDENASTNVDKKEMKRRLASLSKKELRGFCKSHSIESSKDDSKDKLISRIIKSLY